MDGTKLVYKIPWVMRSILPHKIPIKNFFVLNEMGWNFLNQLFLGNISFVAKHLRDLICHSIQIFIKNVFHGWDVTLYNSNMIRGIVGS